MNNYKVNSKEIKELENMFDCKLLENTTDYDYIGYPHITIFKDGQKTIKLPTTKTINKEYLAGRIEKKLNSSYKNLKKLISKLDLQGNIYFTSFGFSYSCFLKNKKTFKKETNKLKNKLDSLGIKYKNEFSDAYWVYRFKISKAKENIKQIKKIIN